MANEWRNELAFRTGSTRIGKFPPMLFITKRNTPTVVERTDNGTISTSIANKIPNHISALKKKEKRKIKNSINYLIKFENILIHVRWITYKYENYNVITKILTKNVRNS